MLEKKTWQLPQLVPLFHPISTPTKKCQRYASAASDSFCQTEAYVVSVRVHSWNYIRSTPVKRKVTWNPQNRWVIDVIFLFGFMGALSGSIFLGFAEV